MTQGHFQPSVIMTYFTFNFTFPLFSLFIKHYNDTIRTAAKAWISVIELEKY